ncbi:hypothetical protein ACFLXQ_00300 [Chloroflexota bacterium]
MKKSLLLVLLTFITFIGLVGLVVQARVMPVAQESLTQPRIFAYRDWQSVGVRVRDGDTLKIRANGTWLYTPGEYHGPEGHPRYGAPSFYPLPGVRGGALIGRIGENGRPFFVGRYTTQWIDEEGTLYLRIDDDILSDNEGYMAVEVTVTQPTPTK